VQEDKVDEINAQGFCVLEEVYSADEVRDLRELLDGYWRAKGSPSLAERVFGIHPLLTRVPGVAPYLANVTVVDTLGAILRDDVRLARTGGRISDESSTESLIRWHNHYGWDQRLLLERETTERVLALVYPDGADSDAGNLVVLPRRRNDPIPPIDRDAPSLPGEVVPRVPPGSVVVIDSALWHTARRGTRPGRRHILGGHYQGWRLDRAHPDDADVDIPQIAQFKRADPVLRGLVERPSIAASVVDGDSC
jgi:hypothetical protein